MFDVQTIHPMKLLFSEAKADYDHYIFPYAIWAFPEAGETPGDLFNQGFLPSSRNLDRFYLCRQVRVNLAQFKPSSENRRILRKFNWSPSPPSTPLTGGQSMGEAGGREGGKNSPKNSRIEPLNVTTPLPSLSSPSEGEERVAAGRERSGPPSAHGEGHKTPALDVKLVPRAQFDYTPERRQFFKTYADIKFGKEVMSFERLDALFAAPIISHLLVFTDAESGTEVGTATLYVESGEMAF